MPPGEVGAVVDPLVAAYQKSYERISEKLVGAAQGSARSARLAEVRDSIGRELSYLNSEVAPRAVQATRWAGDVGFGAGQLGAGASTASLDLIDRGATERLAQGLYKDLLQATSRVDQTSKAVLRRLGRDTSLQKMIEGQTAVQAGRSFARQAHDLGVHAVVYSNGARHGLDEYAAMAMRTTTGLAYNESLVEGALAEECEWFECFDGPDCGLEAHDDTNVADGLVVDAKTASSYPLSHPNCRRSWGPRPDVKSQKEADAARRTTTPEQRADQIAADRARGLPVRPASERAAGPQQRVSKAERGQPPSKAAGAPPPPPSNFRRVDDSWGKKFTPAASWTTGQKTALKSYTGREFEPINRRLRTGNPNKTGTPSAAKLASVDKRVDAISSAMKPLDQDVIVRRGADLSAFGGPTDAKGFSQGLAQGYDPSRMVGTQFTDKGFTSTTVSDTAFKRDVDMIVKAPRGTNAAYLEGVTARAGEQELLFDRGTQYVIESVQKVSTGDRPIFQGGQRHTEKWEMVVRVVGQGGSS